MADVLLFTPATGRITGYRTSVNTLDYLEADQTTPKAGVLINPVLPDPWTTATHRVDAGVVRAYTQVELDQIAADAAAAAAAAAAQALLDLKAWAKEQLIDQRELREAVIAVAEVVTPEINALREQIVGVQTLVWDVGNTTNATGVTSPNITVAGAQFGDFVEVSGSASFGGLLAFGYVSAADTVVIRLHNGTGGSVNPPSATYKVCVRRSVAMPPRTAAQVVTALRNAYDGKVDAWT